MGNKYSYQENLINTDLLSKNNMVHQELIISDICNNLNSVPITQIITNTIFVYVLKCNHDKYYIGRTFNPDIRVDNNEITSLSKNLLWLKTYAPINVVEIIPNCDDYDEDKYTVKYMDMHGINNVRGGSFSSIVLNSDQINVLNQMTKKSDNFDNPNNIIECTDEDSERKLYQILHIIFAIKNKGGYAYDADIIATTLKGERSPKVDPRVKDLTYYGSMKNMSVNQIHNFINIAIDMQYIYARMIKYNQKPILECTPLGISFGEMYDKTNKQSV